MLEKPSARGRGVRYGSILLWYGLPAVVAAAVASYFALLLLWHANPPLVPVAGNSMRPTFNAGDLVLVKAADTGAIRKGDVIAFRTPDAAREEYGLPAALVHRVASVKREAGTLFIRTKGDANAGLDVFKVTGNDVVGRVAVRIPAGGYPFLFFRSRQGTIFLAATAVVGALYILIAFLDSRRLYLDITARKVDAVLTETQALRQVIARAPARSPNVTSPELELVSGGTAMFVPDAAAVLPAVFDASALEAGVREAVQSTADMRETVGELVGAVAEYGVHLRSHTAVMQRLAASTAELQQAATEMRRLLEAVTAVVDAQRPEDT